MSSDALQPISHLSNQKPHHTPTFLSLCTGEKRLFSVIPISVSLSPITPPPPFPLSLFIFFSPVVNKLQQGSNAAFKFLWKFQTCSYCTVAETLAEEFAPQCSFSVNCNFFLNRTLAFLCCMLLFWRFRGRCSEVD